MADISDSPRVLRLRRVSDFVAPVGAARCPASRDRRASADVAPLGVSRPISVEAVNRALAGDRLVLLLLQNNEATSRPPTICTASARSRSSARWPRCRPASTSSSKASCARAPSPSHDRGFMRALLTPLPETVDAVDRDRRPRPPPAGADRSRAVAGDRPVAGAARRWSRASTIRCGSPTCWPACST